MTDMITGLNYRSTIAEQDNKCLQCGKDIDPDKEELYFRMDQAINLYEVYCYKCGLEWEKKDKEEGK